MHKEFSVSFELKTLAFYSDSSPASVIHFTIGNNLLDYGDRNPGVWVSNDKLFIFSSINSAIRRAAIVPPINLIINEWTGIKLSQTLVDNATYQFNIFINGRITNTVVNDDARDFTNVLVYAADPWHPAHNGLIRNLNATGMDDIGKFIVL